MSGLTNHGLDKIVLLEKRKGNVDEKTIREKYSGVIKYDQTMKVLSTQHFTQLEDGFKGEETTSLLITYTQLTKGKNEDVHTLFIPKNGKSIISNYLIMTQPDKSSWVSHKFGKCVNTCK